ncbi:unnamed protein product [Lactuca virosa]|uniref:Uncharacterized protein n=1 Tax=Lactuca virosa TaxID=75947 RepID=A0AAU9M7L9_9ASTR|nr:unnamed protein product [Lactuca virosa]
MAWKGPVDFVPLSPVLPIPPLTLSLSKEIHQFASKRLLLCSLFPTIPSKLLTRFVKNLSVLTRRTLIVTSTTNIDAVGLAATGIRSHQIKQTHTAWIWMKINKIGKEGFSIWSRLQVEGLLWDTSLLTVRTDIIVKYDNQVSSRE